MGQILRAHSCATDAVEAVKELQFQFASHASGLIIFFCSSHYDLSVIATSFNALFPGVKIVGCTSAGEIGPHGYTEHSLCAVSFPADNFSVVTDRLDDLNNLTGDRISSFVKAMVPKMEQLSRTHHYRYAFAMQLIDSLSSKEELISHFFQKTLGRIPLFGGSAADSMQFTHTYVFHEGQFHDNSCVLILCGTNCPFRLFKTQNFVGSGDPLVVTAADPATRTIIELNGLPAADVYAKRIGCTREQLDTHLFSAHPLICKINGNEYTRSIQQLNKDGSLRLYCAIDEGVILRLADKTNLVADLTEQFNKLEKMLGRLSLSLVCDCTLRRMDIVDNNQVNTVADIFIQHNTIGFNSFGEQYGSLHVNQTCTGIAFGCGESGS